MYQLKEFKLPEGFRGRNAFTVQLWWLVYFFLFKPSPQFMYGWRRFLLRLFGSKIGKKVILRPSCQITYPWKLEIGDYSWIGDEVVLYTLGKIKIGSNTVISQRSYLCTGSHDYTKTDFPIFAKPILIHDSCWLAADVFVSPGVEIVDEVIVGARSSVFKSILEKGMYKGTPLKKE
ncbi:WcaF family extracellular polysaccharide biosynthesis acetyltransferase [Flavobacterium sp. XS2P24]|uniref:WcaF family extracellular polysaccharide biosynthesis acetyltransferase n=1 Tax=Flavobacterium sp. XS2P24 TaxID=3041249 RepID=UPI0024A99AB4|nr:WcaF family extracellular polysaccharide biosynthesis acetyltransferase [Flavobacterium sp. XS2P24]MDI6048374.1 WcaF family extracellular polysaccharide biosynthesis acetyltransferase [Flavobacterium sp. XS2P24]